MLAPTMQDVALGTQNLTALAESFMAAGLRSRVLTSLFNQGQPIQVMPGNTAVWKQITGRRHLAPLSGSTSPHVQTGAVAEEDKTSALARIKLYKDIPGDRLYDQTAPGMVTPDGQQRIRIELQDLVNQIGDTVERACGLVLSTGKFTASAANFPGTTGVFDLDFGASSNLAFTRSAAWSTNTTKILSADLVTAIQTAYEQGCGKEAGTIVFNRSVLASLIKNVEFQEFVKYTAGAALVRAIGMQDAASRVLSEFRPGGVDWLCASGSFLPQGGSVTPYFPDSTIAVLPDQSMLGDTLGMAMGRGTVPTGPVFISGAEGAASGLRPASSAGIYSYAEVKGDVPSVRIYAGLVFLPVLLNPINLMRGSA